MSHNASELTVTLCCREVRDTAGRRSRDPGTGASTLELQKAGWQTVSELDPTTLAARLTTLPVPQLVFIHVSHSVFLFVHSICFTLNTFATKKTQCMSRMLKL